jgi:hypothetical protein
MHLAFQRCDSGMARAVQRVGQKRSISRNLTLWIAGATSGTADPVGWPQRDRNATNEAGLNTGLTIKSASEADP